MELRVCVKCEEEKPLDAFAKVYTLRNRGKNYYQHTCLICYRAAHAEKERKRRKDKPEEYRAARKKHRAANLEHCRMLRRLSGHKLKEQAYNAYGGYECVCCGETEKTMLSIDHIDEDGARHRKEVLKVVRPTTFCRGSSGDNLYRWLKNNDFPPGFQVLCYNCNISKHRNKGTCAHKYANNITTNPI
ncbi:MAG: hypothetical protein K2Y18_00385 [Alphaproteobacteria bacterium]|nr:hypothetical protein [Alphaproteobacteria bacterium]